MRPCTYVITEDVITVDTGLGRRYRKVINNCHEASPSFRKWLKDLELAWGLSAVIVGVPCFVVVCDSRVQEEEVACGLGWGIPPIWAGAWATIIINWVQRASR